MVTIHATHEILVRRSAELYLRRLEDVVAGSPAGMTSIIQLRHALELTLERGRSTRGIDLPFTRHSLCQVPDGDRQLLLNPWSLGLGRDDAKVVVIGMEHAYNGGDGAGHLVNFTLETCAGAIVWLTGGRADVISRLAGADWWPPRPRRPFHIHPNDYYRVERLGGRRTWVELAHVLGCSVHDLGTHAYQIELHDAPSVKRSEGRRDVDATRLGFLEEVLKRLRTTAEVLIFHGAQSPKLDVSRFQLARVFLGLGADDAVLVNSVEHDVRVAKVADRCVVFSPAFSGSALTRTASDTITKVLPAANGPRTELVDDPEEPLGQALCARLPKLIRQRLFDDAGEDRLTWEVFAPLVHAQMLGETIGPLFGLPAAPATLCLWGREMPGGAKAAAIEKCLKQLEHYGDGKTEGHLTEPDIVIISDGWGVVLECKRASALGSCGRYRKEECPEIDVARRKRDHCQYWRLGQLETIVSWPPPNPGTPRPITECDDGYQLLRNQLLAKGLTKELSRPFCVAIVQSPRSPIYKATSEQVETWNRGLLEGVTAIRFVTWESIVEAARAGGITCGSRYCGDFR